MAKPFSILRQRMSPERQKRNAERARALIAEMKLDEIRRARELTQQELAKALDISQTAVSKIEHQTDMYVSTLGKVIAAMGGELRIVASFPEGDIPIKQFVILP